MIDFAQLCRRCCSLPSISGLVGEDEPPSQASFSFALSCRRPGCRCARSRAESVCASDEHRMMSLLMRSELAILEKETGRRGGEATHTTHTQHRQAQADSGDREPEDGGIVASCRVDSTVLVRCVHSMVPPSTRGSLCHWRRANGPDASQSESGHCGGLWRGQREQWGTRGSSMRLLTPLTTMRALTRDGGGVWGRPESVEPESANRSEATKNLLTDGTAHHRTAQHHESDEASRPQQSALSAVR